MPQDPKGQLASSLQISLNPCMLLEISSNIILSLWPEARIRCPNSIYTSPLSDSKHWCHRIEMTAWQPLSGVLISLNPYMIQVRDKVFMLLTACVRCLNCIKKTKNKNKQQIRESMHWCHRIQTTAWIRSCDFTRSLSDPGQRFKALMLLIPNDSTDMVPQFHSIYTSLWFETQSTDIPGSCDTPAALIRCSVSKQSLPDPSPSLKLLTPQAPNDSLATNIFWMEVSRGSLQVPLIMRSH